MRIALLAVLIVVSWPARAADPAVCRPYARDFTQQIIRYVWNRSYSHCLLAEETSPALPRDWESAMQIVLPDATPIAPLDRTDISQIGVVPATGRGVGESGFAPDTDGWRAWCKRVFPGSFDQKTGTIIYEPDNRGNRVRCPG